MTPFRSQVEAMGTALLLIQKLPGDVVWSLTCTNDDTAESPTSLNIYTPEARWSALREKLGLRRPVGENVEATGDQFISFRLGALVVSLIEEE